MFIKTNIALLILLPLEIIYANCYAQPSLKFPVDCIEGKDCWVVNYFDIDPAPDSAKDFNCGPRSYDNHKGTDIAIRDWQAMEKGVDVLAAVDGYVLRLRDGVEDKVLTRDQLNTIRNENESCGNGVFIDHGDGWQTIYCHLKKNSIIVKQHQSVKAGQKLGQIGHSGYVEFPHLHIGVTFNDTFIDPYIGLSNQDGCGKTDQSLWADDTLSNYRDVSIYAAGFSDAVPEFDQIKHNAASPESYPIDILVLTFWVSIFGIEKDDQIHMEIRNPEGRIFSERDIIQEKTRARQFLYIGKKNKNSALIKGNYTGVITFSRELPSGQTLKRKISRILSID